MVLACCVGDDWTVCALLLLPRVARPVRAERHHDHLPDDVLAATALTAHQRVLDHRHHAVRACGNESRLDRVEQVLVDLDPVESRLVERGGNVAGGVVLEAKVAAHPEQEDVAQDRAVGVVAHDFGDLRDLAAPVRHARLVDDEVDGRRDLRPDRFERYVDRGHHHHRLEARQRVPCRVGVDGRHASVVAGVHGLQHVEGLGAAHLTDQDPVGAHSEAVAQKLPDGELALALDVGRPVLQRDHVRVVDLQLGRVLDRDHTLVVRDEARDHVEGRRLARPGAARDQDVHAAEHGGLEELRHGGAEASLAGEVLHAEHGVLELADGQRCAVYRGGADDRVDAAAVWQPGVDHGVQAVDVAAGGRHHAADRLEELVLVLEPNVGLRQDAAALDENLVRAVHHDLAHGAVVKQAVEGAVSDRRAKDDVGQRRLLLRVELDAVVGEEAIEVGAHSA